MTRTADSISSRRWARALFPAFAMAALLPACAGEIHGADVDCELDEPIASDEPATAQQGLGVSRTDAEREAAATPKNGRGLPLWESRPGAPVALFLDFDGGVYNSSSSGRTTYRGASLDSDASRFNQEEQVAIVRAAMEVAEAYAPFDVNVTTSDAARTRSDRWAWVLITDDMGSSGRGKIGAIGRSSYATALAGSDAVFSPPSSQRGYLLTHELGHNFGLNHNGLWTGGRFVEWSDLEQSRTGAWMGGRNTYFSRYEWMSLQTEDSTRYQDSVAIIAREAGFAGDGGGTGGDGDGDGGSCDGRCTPSCPCEVGEGDCDVDDDCTTGFCEQQSGTDYCAEPPVSSCDGRCTPSCPCDVGEGDCDVDADCTTGFCEQQSGTDYCAEPPASSCDGQCSPSCPCDVGEGDCDVDADCTTGFCAQQSGTDYCAEPPATNCDGQCSAACQCGYAEGDCDSDADCRSGLFCAQQSGTDYCANDASCHARCGPECPCDEGQGDCDSDADCRAGLVCGDMPGMDFCVRP